jgi:Tol biopolymer transport system component
MTPRPRLGTAVVLSALLLLAAACSGGGGDRDATVPASTTRPLPASLAAAKGWLAYSTFIGDNDRIHLVRPDGSQDHQAFTELPGEAIRADFSHDGQLAFEHRPPNDVHQVYVAKADGRNPKIVAKCAFEVCDHEFPSWSPDGKFLAVAASLVLQP